MIQSVKISNVATFDGSGQEASDLKKINFFFGLNGTGKTTISRVLTPGVLESDGYSDCEVSWENNTPIDVLVYNRDYVEGNFEQADGLKGIFTIGNETIELKNQIAQAKEDIDNKANEISALNKNLSGEDGNGGKQGELSDLEAGFVETCWKAYKAHEADFKDCFYGHIRTKPAFSTKVLETYDATDTDELPSLDELKETAAKLLGGELQRIDPLIKLDADKIALHESNSILGKAVIGETNVAIADLIQHLDNSDWVKQGREHFAKSSPKCPFCQQDVPSSLEADLTAYFNEAYDNDIASIQALVEGYRIDADELTAACAGLLSEPREQLDQTALRAQIDILEALLTENQRTIDDKLKEPSRELHLKPISDAVENCNKVIEAANEAITKNNTLVDTQSTSTEKLKADVWRHISHAVLAESVVSYLQQQSAFAKAIEGLENSIKKAEGELKALRRVLAGLERQTTNTEETRNSINSLLLQFGFTSFSVEQAEEANSYVLKRPDGSSASKTLSEGEKTFLTFLYFYHRLKGNTASTGLSSPRVVVIDDPISSLDSEILFIVSTLVRGLLREALDGQGSIKQVFVLTHNVYFHKEITLVKGNRLEPNSKVSFYRVRRSGNQSTITVCDDNPIRTYYELLWDELRKENLNTLTVRNTMRRILEHYFKILGGTTLYELCDDFEGEDVMVCRCLISWLHDGSHNADDDLFMAGSEYDISAYQRVFEQIFIKRDHHAHYRMMMKCTEDEATAGQPESVTPLAATN